MVEVQDEGSQLAAALCRAAPGEKVLDLCAGGGGKTLALAAAMDNEGEVFASDSDGRRLTPIFARLERAGAKNVTVRAPRGKNNDPVADLAGLCDLVVIDAPCTGVGTWRRNPDAKWRTRPGALEQRQAAQDEVLARGARHVKPGGRLAYITCSLLCEENEDRIVAFLSNNPDFSCEAAAETLRLAGIEGLDSAASPHGPGLRLTPARHDVDGFFVAVLLRAG
jgi:16S rRNA (cytosine967-C5)-methyltransferase